MILFVIYLTYRSVLPDDDSDIRAIASVDMAAKEALCGVRPTVISHVG